VAYLRYYRSWLGASQSKDMNAFHGRRSELTIIRNESCGLCATQMIRGCQWLKWHGRWFDVVG